MSEPLSFEVIEAADVAALSPQEQVTAFVEGTACLHDLIENTVCPVILGQLVKSDFEQAVAGTYYRIALLVRGVASLSDPAHFQIANSVARTIFELVVDLKLLTSDRTLAAKFFAFARVVKFRKAEQLVRFLNDNPSVDQVPHQDAISFASDTRRQEVKRECIKFWGINSNNLPNWPEHWSGRNIADRARQAGLEFEEMYRSQFFLQSQYVHADPAGIQNLSRDALICSFGIAHGLIQRLAATATDLIGNEFRLFDTNLELRERLRSASAASGFYAVEAVMLKPSATANNASD